jgi:hypothetical protein
LGATDAAEPKRDREVTESNGAPCADRPLVGQSGAAEAPGDRASTGDPRVDAVVARLAGVDDAELAEQLDIFTALHAALADILDDTTEAASGPS